MQKTQSMFRNLFSARALPLAALTLLAAGALAWAASPLVNGSNSAKNPVAWNDRDSKELEHEFHRIHVAWNEGDIATVKRLIAGDDVLVTYELDAESQPVALKSKKEIDSFLDRIAQGAAKDDSAYVLEMPTMQCRATGTFGVCTEQCTIHLKYADGTERIEKSFGTGVAVKYADGWKWIQYHMSVAAPPQVVKDAKATKAGS